MSKTIDKSKTASVAKEYNDGSRIFGGIFDYRHSSIVGVLKTQTLQCLRTFCVI